MVHDDFGFRCDTACLFYIQGRLNGTARITGGSGTSVHIDDLQPVGTDFKSYCLPVRERVRGGERGQSGDSQRASLTADAFFIKRIYMILLRKIRNRIGSR